MSCLESRVLNNWQFWRALALVFCSGLIAIGCGGKGGSGGGFGVDPPTEDIEGSSPGDAVVIVPDGAAFAGAINFGGDEDWFTFRAGAGTTYTLQIIGFPPEPGLLDENDLTGLGTWVIRAQIVTFNGVDQDANSTGTDGGTEYDIDIAAFPALGGDGVWIGDSRIVWVAPTTNDFFIRITHARVLSGRGHYVMHLSSSQLGVTFTGRTQFGMRDFASPNSIFDDEGNLVYEGLGIGEVEFFFWEFPELDLGWFLGTNLVFFLDNQGVPETDPQTQAFHIHWGIPDIFNPELSFNFQNCGEDPHCWAYDFGSPQVWAPTPELIRLMTGWPWYADAHITDDFDTLSTPVAVSMPYGDIYSLFESEMAMSESNVIRRDGSRLPESQRGFNPDFTLFYDSSLKTLQIARRTFNSPFLGGFIVPADAESFEGDILTVYSRSPLEVDPIVGASVIPVPEDPPTVFEVSIARFDPGPGFRNAVRQLSDAEAEALRDAYYEDGIYFEVTDRFTGQPISRADVKPLTPGLPSLEIQDVPFPEIIDPTRSSGEPLRKGTINFASDYAGGGQITVVANGQVLGVLNDFVEEGQAPECGETHTGQSLAAEYWPHRYPYKAVAEDGTEWKGHFEIRGGACETLMLSVE